MFCLHGTVPDEEGIIRELLAGHHERAQTNVGELLELLGGKVPDGALALRVHRGWAKGRGEER